MGAMLVTSVTDAEFVERRPKKLPIYYRLEAIDTF